MIDGLYSDDEEFWNQEAPANNNGNNNTAKDQHQSNNQAADGGAQDNNQNQSSSKQSKYSRRDSRNEGDEDEQQRENPQRRYRSEKESHRSPRQGSNQNDDGQQNRHHSSNREEHHQSMRRSGYDDRRPQNQSRFHDRPESGYYDRRQDNSYGGNSNIYQSSSQYNKYKDRRSNDDENYDMRRQNDNHFYQHGRDHQYYGNHQRYQDQQPRQRRTSPSPYNSPDQQADRAYQRPMRSKPSNFSSIQNDNQNNDFNNRQQQPQFYQSQSRFSENAPDRQKAPHSSSPNQTGKNDNDDSEQHPPPTTNEQQQQFQQRDFKYVKTVNNNRKFQSPPYNNKRGSGRQHQQYQRNRSRSRDDDNGNNNGGGRGFDNGKQRHQQHYSGNDYIPYSGRQNNQTSGNYYHERERYGTREHNDQRQNFQESRYGGGNHNQQDNSSYNQYQNKYENRMSHHHHNQRTSLPGGSSDGSEALYLNVRCLFDKSYSHGAGSNFKKFRDDFGKALIKQFENATRDNLSYSYDVNPDDFSYIEDNYQNSAEEATNKSDTSNAAATTTNSNMVGLSVRITYRNKHKLFRLCKNLHMIDFSQFSLYRNNPNSVVQKTSIRMSYQLEKQFSLQNNHDQQYRQNRNQQQYNDEINEDYNSPSNDKSDRDAPSYDRFSRMQQQSLSDRRPSRFDQHPEQNTEKPKEFTDDDKPVNKSNFSEHPPEEHKKSEQPNSTATVTTLIVQKAESINKKQSNFQYTGIHILGVPLDVRMEEILHKRGYQLNGSPNEQNDTDVHGRTFKYLHVEMKDMTQCMRLLDDHRLYVGSPECFPLMIPVLPAEQVLFEEQIAHHQAIFRLSSEKHQAQLNKLCEDQSLRHQLKQELKQMLKFVQNHGRLVDINFDYLPQFFAVTYTRHDDTKKLIELERLNYERANEAHLPGDDRVWLLQVGKIDFVLPVRNAESLKKEQGGALSLARFLPKDKY